MAFDSGEIILNIFKSGMCLLYFFLAAAGGVSFSAVAQNSYFCTVKGETTIKITSCPSKPDTEENCNKPELTEGVRWGMRNNPKARGIMLRAIDSRDSDEIAKGYKRSQSHNRSAADLIDRCNSATIWQIAHNQAERSVRLRDCSHARPASSATCSDVSESLRWSTISSAGCAPFARKYVLNGVALADEDSRKAALIRKGIQIAQTHNQEAYMAPHFIADGLLIQLAGQIVKRYKIQDMPPPEYSESNKFNGCRGTQIAGYPWED